jgi:hypothetical protein
VESEVGNISMSLKKYQNYKKLRTEIEEKQIMKKLVLENLETRSL